ncbi:MULTISPECIES: peptide chain release factor N(5)-glutamine methyltransferase [unclassified Arsukibacterium]|uniref:peptide chain release factor N(5)-glutamine methyltransferase n=1 Tax=unclassified Arsukibacterium TaxID=2635278 RepID=UPI000C93FBE6|nr:MULTISPECIES: peptide chain release factor N(5)-glutamine methyltransferase [unclassified Arsukibacterium]MAA95414.1 protein-(glutamine-N5) methyltransferase, release factor-specific [Rheinheimera sp.]|tara:strand:- start:38398 stop:39237 length:840 start_codon:yes stop_codon:yes gene_type:complete
MTLAEWLQQATRQLSGVSALAADDARLLLCHQLNVSVSYVYGHGDDTLGEPDLQALNQLLHRAVQDEPIAYIIGHWPFWNIELEVASCTLIPRPDTELLVEQALSLSLPEHAKVLDLGTGTGAIALALACNRPLWQVTAVDKISAAVALARRNATRLAASNCTISPSDWFSAVTGQQFDLIVSNPPYIEPDDPHLPALKYEPVSALVAAERGLADLATICQQAPAYLATKGWLWLEHGYNQAEDVQQLLTTAGFNKVQSRKDYGGNWRISGGCLNSHNE